MYMFFCYVKFHSRLFWIDKCFMSIYEHWFKIRTFQSHISFMQIKFLLQLSFFDFIYELNHYRVIKHHDVDISPTLIHAFFCSLTSISRSFHKFHNNIFFFFLHITIMSTTKRFFVIRMCFHFTINDINVNEYVINENDLQLMINISQMKTFFSHETTKLTRFQLRFRFFFFEHHTISQLNDNHIVQLSRSHRFIIHIVHTQKLQTFVTQIKFFFDDFRSSIDKN